jgi:hypothetical protein
MLEDMGLGDGLCDKEEEVRMASIKCQCKYESVYHKAGECQNNSRYSVVDDDGQTRFVCGDCRLTSHKDVKEIENGIQAQ